MDNADTPHGYALHAQHLLRNKSRQNHTVSCNNARISGCLHVGTQEIAYLGKRAENRGWPFPPALAGELIAIHAGKTIGREPVAVPRPQGLAGLFDSQAEQDRWQAWRLGRPAAPSRGNGPAGSSSVPSSLPRPYRVPLVGRLRR